MLEQSLLLTTFIAWLACLAVGCVLIARSRASSGGRPRCGHCDYDLTGSEGNRCPECGRLFIEAGIVVLPAASKRLTRWVRAVMLILSVLLLLTILVPAVYRAGYGAGLIGARNSARTPASQTITN